MAEMVSAYQWPLSLQEGETRSGMGTSRRAGGALAALVLSNKVLGKQGVEGAASPGSDCACREVHIRVGAHVYVRMFS